jgi:hypothetical protein
MVNYARTGASILRVLPVPRADGGHDVRYLDSGQNPPNGVVVVYYLPEVPASIKLSFLDSRGRVVRAFDNVSAKAGVNRFVWNRRLPGAPNVLAADLEPVPRPDGPMVVPGRYSVRLTIGGRSQTQSFELLRDPRIKTGARDLSAQFDFLKAILAALATVNGTINDVDAMLAQLANLDRRPGSAALRKASTALRRELGTIRGRLIDVNYSQAQLYAAGLHEKLNALFDTVDSGDYAPAQQTRELFAAISAQLDVLLARWAKARERLVPALNRAAAKARLPVVG